MFCWYKLCTPLKNSTKVIINMNKLISALAVAVTLMFGQSVYATVLSFDDIAVGTDYGSFAGAGASNYGGLNWSSDVYWMNATTYCTNCGYHNANTSGDYIAFNAAGNNISASDGTFDFNGVNLTSAWNNGLNVQVQGWLGGALIYDTTVSADTTGPSWYDFNYVGIDQLTFNSYGGTNAGLSGNGVQFAMDDFTFTASSVPEPGTLAMIGLGLVGIGMRRRKKYV
jgi:hypothetical protein